MPAGSASTSLSITNPLVLYRALIVTNKIKPDPAQHRLAIQLQKLYYRLIDYSPELEYRSRLDQISRSVAASGPNVSQQRTSDTRNAPPPWSDRVSAFLRPLPSSIKSLTRTTQIHESALEIDSPHGMLLYGEVGRGKSMLLDMLYTSLPSGKKRRWHFNTFMLDIFRRLEQTRIERMRMPDMDHEHVVLALAKDTIGTSPIIFLDEFQMPDRTSSKLLNTFMTAFFHLGGVLIASSNRMPEELAKASGIDFSGSRRQSKSGLFGWGLSRSSEGQRASENDFAKFVEVLKARCEVWEMEGDRDWRRDDETDMTEEVLEDLVEDIANKTSESVDFNDKISENGEDTSIISSDSPRHYYVHLTEDAHSSDSAAQMQFVKDVKLLNPTDSWTPTVLTVYSRRIHLPQTYNGIVLCPFDHLCNANLGPADYVSLCSTFHTIIITHVPVLTTNKKNEARRFITLLDALYESRCRLLINADAPPDGLFFPDQPKQAGRSRGNYSAHQSGTTSSTNTNEQDQTTTRREDFQGRHGSESESIASESYSEVYLDTTSPFRPNISTYQESSSSIFPSPFSNQNLNSTRSILADEDADFGPTYGNGRSPATMSTFSPLSPILPNTGPDFTDTTTLTGTDERFAYKRARSRLWEMCGKKWWKERSALTPHANNNPSVQTNGISEVPEWWNPIPLGSSGRFWESTVISPSDQRIDLSGGRSFVSDAKYPNIDPDHTRSEPHVPSGKDPEGTSPFRTYPDPPPKFGWQHAWGMMKWGKKAGEWGKGVEAERFMQKDNDGQGISKDDGQEKSAREK